MPCRPRRSCHLFKNVLVTISQSQRSRWEETNCLILPKLGIDVPSHLLYEDRKIRSGSDLVTSKLRAKVHRLAKAANAMHDLKRILTIPVDMATKLSLSVILS